MENARRRRFIEYFQRELRGDRAKLILKLGMTKGRIAQLFDERQPFGERAGRSIADRLQLPPDYFEHDHYVQPGSRDALTALILAQFGDDREKLRSSVARLREMADQIESIVASPPSPRPPTGPAPEPAEPRSPKRGGKVG